MPEPSRRAFLVTTGAGAAAGVLAAAPGADASALRSEPRAKEPMIVHIADPDGAELHIHLGDHTAVVHDRELVLRIQHAAARTS